MIQGNVHVIFENRDIRVKIPQLKRVGGGDGGWISEVVSWRKSISNKIDYRGKHLQKVPVHWHCERKKEMV